MKKYRTGMMLAIALGFLASAGLATPSLAETGAVSVVFTKGGFIVGVGGGQGVLSSAASGILHGVGHERGLHDRRVDKFVGRALNLRSRRWPAAMPRAGRAARAAGPAACSCRTPMA
jgi:hypothetical protein